MSEPSPLTVPVELGSRRYEVEIGHGLLEGLGPCARQHFGDKARGLLLTDANVEPLHARRALQSLRSAGLQVELMVVPAGEGSKSMACAQQVCSAMTRAALDRKSFLVALGGGVIGDLGGYCAAIYQRGIGYIQCPTTVLSQVDSSVGGKTGVNLPEAKNMVGCFHQPRHVLADIGTLKTLAPREFNEGFAEIIKHACIRDAAMLEAIEAVAKGGGDLPALIARNVAIKAAIVEADEHETLGLRALLNFGHTLGHAIEAAAAGPHWQEAGAESHGNALLHGEAISLGLRAALHLSVVKRALPQDEAKRVLRLLEAFALPLQLPDSMSDEALLEIAAKDKKFEQGSIRFVLLKALGEAQLEHDVTTADLRSALSHLRQPAKL